jgi:hypothetical protein
MKINPREVILEHVSELDIFFHYLGQEVKLGRPIVSPLRQEKHPSFNLYQSPSNGKIYYKDFGDERGDCFNFVMKLFGCSFPEALQTVAQDFSIDLGVKRDVSGIRREKKIRIPQIFIIPKKEFPYARKEWTTDSLDLWIKVNVTTEILLEYNTWSVDKVKIKKRDSEEWFILKGTEQDPIYCFDYENGTKKFYRPKVKDKKFKFMSNLCTKDIFGLKQLKQEVAKNGKVKVLIICAGQKDCLSLYGSIGIRGIALNSESASITKELFIELLQYAENILVCYDNDETGIKNAAKIKQDIGIDNIFLGDISPAHDVNDLYDYFSKQYDKQSFLNLIESKIC